MTKNIQCCFQRYEKKYLITPAQYEKIKSKAAKYMQADVYGNYSICNLYYDTVDFQLIRASLEKPVYKEKLRMRSYGIPRDGDSVFVELKKKYDGVVYKRRAVMEAAEAANYLGGIHPPHQKDQIRREIDWFLNSYHPKPQVFIAYDREALAGLNDSELRITFDTNLRWRDIDLDLRLGDYGNSIIPQTQILMEVKIPGAAPVWLSYLLSDIKVFPISFSKYGICYQQNLMEDITNMSEKVVAYSA